MHKKSEASLKNFYIFNPKYGPKEGEEENKILFYSPLDIDIDTKVKDIGLSEAIIKFTNTFTSDDSCHTLHTQKTCQVFYQPELEYWMVMTINVPCEVKTKDGCDYNEYRGDDVQDTIYQAVLQQSYKMFRLFMGSFESNFVGDTLELKLSNLISKLELFYTKYLLTIQANHCDILNIFKSIQYLPLHQLLFLRVHNYINMIEATFPSIKHSIFLYNEQIVWSGINPSDMYSIYEYLVGTLFPKYSQLKIFSNYVVTGNFITGPKIYESCITVPKVHIYNEGEACETFYLIVYRALSATICLFVKDTELTSNEFYQELQSFIGPQLTSIASEIGENFSSQAISANNAEDPGPKYLYFNELNLRHSGTIYLDQWKSKKPSLPLEVMNLLTDLYKNSNQDGTTEETIVKSMNDYWIVKRSSNLRHFFVIINKNSTLMEITEEAKKIYDQHIKNVFFDR